MFGKILTATALAGALTLWTTTALATTQIFSDFGPKSSFDQGANAGNYINGESGQVCCGVLFYAQPFIPAVSGNLDHIDIALAYVSGAQGVVISVVNDSPYLPNFPGPLGLPLEQFVRRTVPVAGTTKPMKVPSLLHPGLSAGTRYWIVVTPIGYDTRVQWKWNITGNQESYLSPGSPFWDKDPTHDVGGAFDVWIQ